MAHKAKTSLNLADTFIAIDVETTGLDATYCEIIEIGAVVVEDGNPTKAFSTLVKPRNPIPSFITFLTGIDDEMVEDAPYIEDVIAPVSSILDGSTVVGHNVCFDDKFLKKAMDDNGIICQYTMVDTLRMSRHVLKDLESHTLGDIAYDLNVPYYSTHRAQDDALVAALCALAMRPMIFEKFGNDPDSIVGKSHSRGSRKLPNPEDLQPTIDEIDESNPFFGSHILFTGKLSNMTRAEAMQKAVNLGAIPMKAFSKKMDYLVVGSFDFCSSVKDGATGKMKKAQEAIASGAPMQIVSESFFLDFANEV